MVSLKLTLFLEGHFCLKLMHDGCYIFPQDDLNFYFGRFLIPVVMFGGIKDNPIPFPNNNNLSPVYGLIHVLAHEHVLPDLNFLRTP